jgi:hypothetical protein
MMQRNRKTNHSCYGVRRKCEEPCPATDNENAHISTIRRVLCCAGLWKLFGAMHCEGKPMTGLVKIQKAMFYCKTKITYK